MTVAAPHAKSPSKARGSGPLREAAPRVPGAHDASDPCVLDTLVAQADPRVLPVARALTPLNIALTRRLRQFAALRASRRALFNGGDASPPIGRPADAPAAHARGGEGLFGGGSPIGGLSWSKLTSFTSPALCYHLSPAEPSAGLTPHRAPAPPAGAPPVLSPSVPPDSPGGAEGPGGGSAPRGLGAGMRKSASTGVLGRATMALAGGVDGATGCVQSPREWTSPLSTSLSQALLARLLTTLGVPVDAFADGSARGRGAASRRTDFNMLAFHAEASLPSASASSTGAAAGVAFGAERAANGGGADRDGDDCMRQPSTPVAMRAAFSATLDAACVGGACGSGGGGARGTQRACPRRYFETVVRTMWEVDAAALPAFVTAVHDACPPSHKGTRTKLQVRACPLRARRRAARWPAAL